MAVDPEKGQRVRCHVGALLDERHLTLTDLADQVGVTVAIARQLPDGSRARHP